MSYCKPKQVYLIKLYCNSLPVFYMKVFVVGHLQNISIISLWTFTIKGIPTWN